MVNTRHAVKLTLPNQLSYLPVAQATVREVARRRGFDDAALGEIEVGVEEAVTNVMKHAYDVEENPTFDLVCEPVPGGMQIIVHEKGIPFDPNCIPRYQPDHVGLDDAASGMGLYLMKSMMDDVQIVNLGPEGKETRLVKLLKNPAAAATEDINPVTIAEPDVIEKKIEFDVRLMAPHEAIEVSRCAFKSHGYSFFDDHIYYPERLVALNESGDMISAVAVTKDNVFMGHAALLYEYPEDPEPELTFVFVNVEYRGRGVFNRLHEFLVKTPKRRECAGIYAYAVANHVFTQKTNARFGMNDCGILLATSPRNWKFKGIPGDPTQRISVVLSYKYMDKPKAQRLYPPAHHREMVVKLYRSLGAEHDWRTPPPNEVRLPEGASEILMGVNLAEGCAEIFVKRYGTDVVREVRAALRGHCLQRIACVDLFLNLQDPATCTMTREFEKLGFFFAGVLPRGRIGDTLILQYLNNVDLAYDKIAVYSDMAKEMLGYIRARDPNAGI